MWWVMIHMMSDDRDPPCLDERVFKKEKQMEKQIFKDYVKNLKLEIAISKWSFWNHW